jgi:type I restriction enzyme M protein
MDKIVATMNERQEIDDFSVLVSLKDIEQKKCSFSAGQYFKVKIEYVDLTPEEFQQKMADYEQQLKVYFDEGHRLEEEILKGLGELKFD